MRIKVSKYVYDVVIKNRKENIDVFNARKNEKFETGRNLYRVSLHKGKTPIASSNYSVLGKLIIPKKEPGMSNEEYLGKARRGEIKPLKEFNTKEEAEQWLKEEDKKAEYTWLEWDKPLTKGNREKILNQLEKEGFKNSGLYYYFENLSDEMLLKGEFVYGKMAEIGGLLPMMINNEMVKSVDEKQASLFLLRAGIDGVKYPAESIARGATSDTARGFNYVVFDENAVSIEEVIKFQKDAVKARGAMMITLDGQATIYALTDPNVSTPLHELAHVFEHYLTDEEKATVQEWAKTEDWTIKTSEAFARGFEKYLAEGKAPTPALQRIFDNFKQWLTEIYNGITGSDIDIELNKPMRDLYAKMFEFTGEDGKPQQQAQPEVSERGKGKSAKSAESLAGELEKALNAMKVKIDRGAAREATFMIPALVYNSAIDAAILTVKAADVVTKEVVIKAINAAVKYVNANFKGNWDNGGFVGKLSVDLTKPMESYEDYKRVKEKGKEPSPGQKVGVRFNLNIQDYGRKGVLSVHDKTYNGEVIDIVKSSTVSDVKFSASKSGASKIKEGLSNKFPIASVDGSFVSSDVDKALTENGQRVFFNPKIADFFYDKDGQEVLSASKATLDGSKVFADGLKYGERVAPIEQQQAQAETKPTRKAKTVFHAGTLEGKGNIYVSPIREQANEYSSMSGAPVLEGLNNKQRSIADALWEARSPDVVTALMLVYGKTEVKIIMDMMLAASLDNIDVDVSDARAYLSTF